MPALAGLLIVIGIGAIKPSRIYSVVKSGPLPTAIMAVTFGLTLVIPLQFAVLVGVGLGIILFVAQQSNRVRVRQVHVLDDGRMRESAPPPTVAAGDVVILQPYGSLFFASAPIFEHQLPAVSRESQGAVVIIRLRGTDQIGLSLIEVLRRYAHDCATPDSSPQARDQREARARPGRTSADSPTSSAQATSTAAPSGSARRCAARTPTRSRSSSEPDRRPCPRAGCAERSTRLSRGASVSRSMARRGRLPRQPL